MLYDVLLQCLHTVSQSLYASKINRLVHTYVSPVHVLQGRAESQSFNPMSIRMTKTTETIMIGSTLVWRCDLL